ncbi:unnamed protein product [Closterium sp. NIES-54]
MAEHIDVTSLTQERLNELLQQMHESSKEIAALTADRTSLQNDVARAQQAQSQTQGTHGQPARQASQHGSVGQPSTTASDGVIRNNGEDDHGATHSGETNAAGSQPRVTINPRPALSLARARPRRPLSPTVTAALATAATATATAATAAPTYYTAMDLLCVLAFDHEGRPVQFDTWLDDLQPYLLSDSKDRVSLFEIASGAATPPSGDRSWHVPPLSSRVRRTAALQDAMVTTTTPGVQRVSICTCTRMRRHLTTFTRRPGSRLYTLATEPSQVAASAQFCRGEGILQSFTLPDSPQQNGIAERRIGLVMEVARTSMIHAAAPHFLWLFAILCAANQLNLWPRVSLPETSPTLPWTGEVGDASVFRVWGSRAFVRDTSADKLSPCAIPRVFLGFVSDAPGWHFYHPTLRRVFLSQDGPAPSDVSQVDPLPGPAPIQVAVGSGAARGAASGGAESGGVEPGGAGSEGAETGVAEPGGVGTWGDEPGVRGC